MFTAKHINVQFAAIIVMLEQIFGSKTRTRLLRLFLLHPEQPYFIRELTRRIDTQINSVRRELKNLVDCGIICEVASVLPEKKQDQIIDTYLVKPFRRGIREKGKVHDRLSKKFFKINQQFSLYLELRELFLKSPILFQNDLAKEAQNIGDVDAIIMSGFFVNRIDSPVDLLIVGTVTRQRLMKIIQAFEKEYEREINFATMTREEYRYRKSVTDRFLFKILEGKRIIVFNRLADEIVESH